MAHDALGPEELPFVVPCAAGLFVGGASTWYALRTQTPHRLRACAQVGLVASLTTAIGCVGLGMGSALAVLGAIAAGAALAWAPIRARI